MSLFGLWFDDPWLFLGLLVLPLMVWRIARLRGKGRVPVPSTRGLGYVAGGPFARLWWVPDGLRVLAVGALVVAAARPQIEDRRVVTGEGVDMMLALDVSASMNAVDMTEDELERTLSAGKVPQNRFELAREILARFIASREQDRVGLVVFGPEAWLKYPLTLDYARLVTTLGELVLDNGLQDPRTGQCTNACTVSGAGTAIGDAVGRAYNRLRRSKAKSKLIVLITDGKQEGGKLDPLAIARHIRDLPEDERPRIFTFLVGTQESTWMPQVDFRGRTVRDRSGLPVYGRPARPFPIDPELLRQMAEMTGGKFYESYSEAKFKEDIRDLERTVFKSRVHTSRSDVFGPWALAGLLLLAGEWALRFTRFRSIV